MINAFVIKSPGSHTKTLAGTVRTPRLFAEKSTKIRTRNQDFREI